MQYFLGNIINWQWKSSKKMSSEMYCIQERVTFSSQETRIWSIMKPSGRVVNVLCRNNLRAKIKEWLVYNREYLCAIKKRRTTEREKTEEKKTEDIIGEKPTRSGHVRERPCGWERRYEGSMFLKWHIDIGRYKSQAGSLHSIPRSTMYDVQREFTHNTTTQTQLPATNLTLPKLNTVQTQLALSTTHLNFF